MHQREQGTRIPVQALVSGVSTSFLCICMQSVCCKDNNLLVLFQEWLAGVGRPSYQPMVWLTHLVLRRSVYCEVRSPRGQIHPVRFQEQLTGVEDHPTDLL